MSNDCLFCKIASGEIPSHKIYEDDLTVAFLDINPVNLGHTLVIPKKHAGNLRDISEEDYLAVQKTVKRLAPKIAEALGACGYNIGQNNEPCSGQVVMHLHVHIMPRFEGDGYKLWHGKELSNEDAKKILEKIKQKPA